MSKQKANINDGVNQNILNIIAPSGLEIKNNRFMLGENYAKCFAVTCYPTNPEYGWLSKITQIEGTTAKIEFHPTDSGALIQRCNEQIRAYRIDLGSIHDESERISKTRAIDDITNMIKRINMENEVVGYINVMLLIQGSTEQKLEDREKKVNSIISSFSGRIRNLVFQQKSGYQSIAPYGLPHEKIGDIGFRNMPLSTYIGGFVNSTSGFNDGDGYLLGKSDNGKPIIINTDKRGGDRTNANWFITGIPGMGKSATVKNIVLMEYALGIKCIFLDPEREYIDLVLNLGGKVINCGGGKGGKINPLQVKPVPKKNKDDLEEDMEEGFQNEGKGLGDLALHIQNFRTFIHLYKRDLNELEIAKLEEILEGTYCRFGITWNTDVSTLKPIQFPIFSDLYEDILKEYEENPNNEILENLKAYLRSISIGADAAVFNGYTDVEIEMDDIIDLDISALLEGDDCILKAQFHNINSFVWQAITKDRTEKYLYIIDEGYLIVDPENPQPLIFVKNFAKRCRKYEAGIMFVTHSVVDVLDAAVKRHGQALIDLACYKFVMGTDGKNLKDTKDLFNLTEAEIALLSSQQRGRGLLFAGSSRIGARIEIPQKFLELMGTAGGR